MAYVLLPLDKIDFSKPLPVNLWDSNGNLLLRKGQSLLSERPHEFLTAHQAAATETDLRAWQRGYDRMIYAMLREGVSLEEIVKAKMPAVLQEDDYTVAYDVDGGWLDLRAVLAGILDQGEAARKPLERLEGIQAKATALLKADADESLFFLFQALAETSLGYCASHALLCAAVCELTAQKIRMPDVIRPLLFRAALTMNIGMAREQDILARQAGKPDEMQLKVIAEHPQRSAAILRKMGVLDEDVLDMVALHHEPDESQGLKQNLECRAILRMADRFVARMAPRSTRQALSALGAAKSMVTQAAGGEARLGSAMAAAVGFYPPGTYVTLVNGETAISVRRGQLANAPMVVSIVDNLGVAMVSYAAKDTGDRQFAVQAPVDFERIKVNINAGKILKTVPKPGSSA